MQKVVYRGKQVALLTQHGKEKLLAPVLEPALGCSLHHVTGFNTDLLGTFTRDIPRDGSQLEAARRKAHIGMEMCGLNAGLASEGAFGTDPFMGMLPWNLELLVFIDKELDIEVVGVAQGYARNASLLTAAWQAAEMFARQVDFPNQHLILRPESQDDFRIIKGISAWSHLETAFAQAQSLSSKGLVFLETDMRAYANPVRQENIRLAAEDLVSKIACSCPQCGMPGFSRIERLAGLPCSDCGRPTQQTRADILGCKKCQHKVMQNIEGKQFADPGQCPGCNP